MYYHVFYSWDLSLFQIQKTYVYLQIIQVHSLIALHLNIT